MTPFLNDLVLFLLDQKVWLNVKYSVASERLSYMGNHCISVITDHEQFEKIVLFGGITNKVGETMADLTSEISNKTYLLTVSQRQGQKSLFKQRESTNGTALGSKMSKFGKR
jgi:hypothetical protein